MQGGSFPVQVDDTHEMGILNENTVKDLSCNCNGTAAAVIQCNFLMVDFDMLNGPTRQIPGTQHSHENIPDLDEEPEWMKLSTVCPAPAGRMCIRDPRAWHGGGTPNLSHEVRAIPNMKYYAPWFKEPMPLSMPRKIYHGLSQHGPWISRYIVADQGEEIDTGFRKNPGGTPLTSKSRPSP